MHTYAKLWLHMRRAQMQLADKCAAPIAISGSAHEAKERMRSVMKNEKFLFKSGKQTSRRDDLAAARAYQYERGATNVNFYVFFVFDLSQKKKQKRKHLLDKSQHSNEFENEACLRCAALLRQTHIPHIYNCVYM